MRRRRLKVLAAAFTLLEVLVVLAVMAVIAAIAIPSIARQSPDRQVLAQAERLKQVLDVMCENAETDGRILGLAIAQDSYAVLMPPALSDDPKAPWETPKKRAIFSAHTLPKGMNLALSLGANEEVTALKAELPERPQLPCAGLSELAEFRLRVSLGTGEAQVARSLVAQPPSVDKVSNFAVMLEPEKDR